MIKISSRKFLSPLRVGFFSTNQKYAFNDPNHSKLMIIGAGFSGLQAAAHIPHLTRLGKYHMRAFDYKTFVHYTPLYDTIPFGFKSQDEIERPILQLLNDTIKMEFSEIHTIKADQNKLVTVDNKEYMYDYLVVASGLVPTFNKVKGLEESLNDRDTPVISTYNIEATVKAKRELDVFQSGTAIFYSSGKAKVFHSGLNFSILFEEMMRRNRGKGHREMTHISYITDNPTIFPHVKHSLKLQQILNEKKINFDNTSLELVEVDGKNRIATFVNSRTHEKTTQKFDLLYVNPEFELPNFLKPLAEGEGYLDINPLTMIHNEFNNIFALGHAARCKGFITTPKAITQQSTTLCGNLEVTMAAKAHSAKPSKYAHFSGNTNIPLFVGNKKILNIELDNEKLDSFNSPSSTSYYKELYVYPNIYFSLLTQGVWYGETGFRRPSIDASVQNS